jgi:NAD(P)-dependent dehydrogenase (short-subunit alcohol dehydrogenase family)
MYDLRGKNVVITGASKGLGAYYSEIAAKSGANVYLIARDEEKLESVCKKINSEGGTSYYFRADVSKPDEVKSVVNKIRVHTTSKIHVLINNAGNQIRKSFLDYEVEDFDSIYNVHVRATWLFTKLISAFMIESKIKGSIINISSNVSFQTRKNMQLYSSAKAAINQLTKAMSNDLSEFGIRVNAIAPGVFKTELNKEILDSDGGKEMISKIPLKRIGEYSELSDIMLLLCSDKSSYITGSIFNIDGGYANNSI